MLITRQLTYATALAFGLGVLFGPAAARAQQQPPRPENDAPRVEAPEDEKKEFEPNGFLEEIDLTDEQRQQIGEILNRHAQEMAQHYQLFTKQHLQAIGIEAMLYTALEEQMTDEQKEQLQQRLQRRDAEEQLNGRPAPPVHDEDPAQPRPEELRQDDAEKQLDVRHENPQHENPEHEQDARFNAEREPADEAKQPADREEQEVAERPRRLVIIGIRVAPRAEDYQVGLTDEQQEHTEAVHQAYAGKLQQAWRNLSTLHNRMVQLELQKLSEIEEVLTEEQLEQLHEWRKQTLEQPEHEPVGIEEPEEPETPELEERELEEREI
jgi:Spy/CpxP family protein refolding chaperone